VANGTADRRPALRVVALVATFAGAATWIALAGLRHLHAVAAPFALPWWALALGFCAAEFFVIDFERGRDTHSFSMVEIPMVAGFYFASPLTVLLSRLLGASIALVVHRRPAPLKLAFNLSLFALESAVGLAVFRAIGGPDVSVRPGSWPAPFVACMILNLVGVIGVTLAIAVTSGRVPMATLRQSLVETALLGPIANTSISMCVVVLLWYEPAAVAFMAVVALVVAAAYRGYVALSARYANLTKLYEFNERAQPAEPGHAVASMLDAARDAMSAETACLALVLPDGSRSVHVSRDADEPRNDGGASATNEPDVETLRLLLGESSTRLVRNGAATPDEQAVLGPLGWRDCIVVEIERAGEVRGLLAVANRLNAIASFQREDVALFSALASHAEVILANADLVERLRHDALHDTLTGLANRVGFNRKVDEAIAARRDGDTLCVLLMDLDRFKQVNDTLGHDHGDRLLVEVGHRLVRATVEDATVARLGGDEFAVLVPSCGDAAGALEHATAVDRVLRTGFRLRDMQVDAPAAIGIAICPDHGDDATTLLQRADVAMYVSKSSGQVEAYSPERDSNTRQRLELVGELRTAIASGQLEVWFQPQADARTDVITHLEALVRWRHPVRGIVPPDDFIPVAEQSGLIGPLTERVLTDVARQWRQWTRNGLSLTVGVNVSMRNLQERDFAERVGQVLRDTGMPTSALTVEITESSIMADTGRTLVCVDELARAGIDIAIDDFGTGYSSLTHLRELPVREVKIDKSFVMHMDTEPGDATIVRAVIDLARNLELTVVAEGVETEAAAAQLRAWGCHRLQGYLLAKPMPADAMTTWLAARTPRVFASPALGGRATA
jgi:diguanylate cyclase (GGDEF)-like protein